jgi:hypothetical protein
VPITLVATAADANANTYCTLAEANSYNDQRPFASSWASLTSDDDRARALIQATILLDASFVWTGAAATDTQALCWPRTGMTNRNGRPIGDLEIPRDLKYAEAEFARQLAAADRIADNDALKSMIETIKAGPVELGFKLPGSSSNSVDMRDADVIRAGPEFFWLGKDIPDAVLRLIVPSWYNRDTVSQPLIFVVN